MSLTVVLVEPAGPLNLGSVARLCANFGVEDLRLVAPRCDPGDLDAQRMAVHGDQVLKRARHFPTLFDALTDCQRVVASCGRIDHGEIPLQAPEQVMPWVQQGLESAAQVALVFGRENRGLSNEELLLSQRVVRLHSSEAYPSLNLSHAVAVMLHELERVRRQPTGQLNAVLQEVETAEPTQLINCLNDAEDLLLEAGFLLQHTARARMAKVKGLLQRALVRPEELAMLRGMVRQLRWAIRCHRP
ncbi:RNA methyltransferase/ TrmH / group 1 family protein [Synechococcus sp. BIOS-U3-1]|uniref:RNA methyltransferase n=1 Tax=Synechococcus sp. BIOS-U3-1 TaxID=1400865 RepID=UPI000C35123B|nr:RNA methyltransferase [Synechococcus sp. BIOS-U3-1]MAD68400.1 rRNA methyltransferase [Synechococcus sp. CPC100]QNI57971.1 RNA methyltransferase/ TrmH / group 1 family protein [Synechococcus sp. BIOS-U3-1]